MNTNHRIKGQIDPVAAAVKYCQNNVELLLENGILMSACSVIKASYQYQSYLVKQLQWESSECVLPSFNVLQYWTGKLQSSFFGGKKLKDCDSLGWDCCW